MGLARTRVGLARTRAPRARTRAPRARTRALLGPSAPLSRSAGPPTLGPGVPTAPRRRARGPRLARTRRLRARAAPVPPSLGGPESTRGIPGRANFHPPVSRSGGEHAPRWRDRAAATRHPSSSASDAPGRRRRAPRRHGRARARAATDARGLDDAITRKSLHRSLGLEAIPAAARARLIALSIAELLSVSWSELDSDPTPPIEPEGPRSSVAEIHAARAVARERARRASPSHFTASAFLGVELFTALKTSFSRSSTPTGTLSGARASETPGIKTWRRYR